MPKDLATAKKSINNVDPPILQIPDEGRKKNLSSSQAFNKMKIKLKKQGINQELRPMPHGSPLFMLGYAEGYTRPLLHLYDTGCGSVLFRSGVPEKEMKGCVLKTRGPYTVGAVGGTSVQVKDEFMVTVNLANGSRQVLEGWSIDKITDALLYHLLI